MNRAAATRPHSDPQRTAIHESGHAIACVAQGYYPEQVSIVPTVTTDGHCRLPERMDAMAQAVATLAGNAAERSVYGWCRFGVDERDQEIAAGLVGPQNYWLNDEARDKARAITDRNGSAIQALSRAALKYKTLDTEGIAAVLSQYGVC